MTREEIIEKDGKQFRRVHITEYLAVITLNDEGKMVEFEGEWVNDKELSLKHARGHALAYCFDSTRVLHDSLVSITYKERPAYYDEPYKPVKPIVCAGRFLPSENKPAYGGWDLH